MQETGSYKLRKPEGTDIVNIDDLNANADIIDRELANKAQKEHTHSNYVNQNAFSNVKVGSVTIEADSTTDILTLAAGNNVTLTPDATADKVTISAANTVYTHPTTSGNKHIPSGGSSGQVLKWSADGTATWGVEKDTIYTHPTYTSKANGLYKVTVDDTGHVSATSAVTKTDIINLGIPGQDTNTTYGAATTSTLGLVKSGTDITVDSSGNVSVVDDSHNHVISNVDGLQSALDTKASTSHTHSNYINQNAFSNVKVGTTTITADNATDVLTLEAGNNVTLISDTTNDKVTISATNTVYTHPATAGNKHIPAGGGSGQILKWTANGTAAWQTEKDTIYTHPTYNSKINGLYKITVNGMGHVSAASAVTKTDITNLGIAPTNSPVFIGSMSMTRKEGTTVGNYSIAAGYQVEASGFGSIAVGEKTQATNGKSFAQGLRTMATGPASYAEGSVTVAKGINSHSAGEGTIATSWSQFSLGRFNKDDGGLDNAVRNFLIIGNGSNDTSRSNCFRVTSYGSVYGLSAFQSSGADYAEYFEWLDGNSNDEDRVGYFVTMEGSKIMKAKSNEDYILGIVSAQPCIIGNSDEDWLGRWKHDEFGRFLTRKIESDEATGVEYIPNSDYDPNQPYIERKDRKEWSAIGMMGVLAVRDDGTCKVNGFCNVKEGGIATATNDRNGYRVIERVTENIIKVIFR